MNTSTNTTDTTAVPSPALMPKFKQPVLAHVDPADDAKVVRDGEHDGAVKAKHLKPGQEVRPLVRDRATQEVAPRGSLRVVEQVTRNEDGSQVYVEFSSPHVAQWYAAAYRFHDESLVGTPLTPVRTRKPSAKPRPRPEVDEHLTHRPFEALKGLAL